MKTKILKGGIQMPEIALGVWQSGPETKQAVMDALEAGYRHIDTAAAYHNEEAVGQALAESSIDRKDLFITTKVWNDVIRAGKTKEALQNSLNRLGLEYVDLLLLHWPVEGSARAYLDMMELRDEGKVRAIGVSNFKKHHLEDLMEKTGEIPAVDQMEFNPLMQDHEILEFCQDHDIVLEAWSPLGNGTNLHNPSVMEIAKKHGKSPAQIILKWLLSKGIVILPKSVHKNRIIENIDLDGFVLDAQDIAALDGLNEGKRSGPDPDNFDF